MTRKLTPAALLLLVGCRSQPAPDPLIGFWTASNDHRGFDNKELLEYRQDGSFSARYQMDTGTKRTESTLTGSWRRLKGEQVAQKYLDVKVKLTGFEPAERDVAMARFRANKDQVLAQANQFPTVTIRIEANSMKMSVGDRATTYQRQQ